MPYGIRIENGRSVTVISENTPAATYLTGDYFITKRSDFSPVYCPNPRHMVNSVPAIQLDSNIRSIRMWAYHDTEGAISGYVTNYWIESYSGIPSTYLIRRVLGFSELSPSTDTYGIRVYNGSGGLCFDSGYNLATPTWSGAIRLGNNYTFPANGWWMPLSSYLYNDNNWNTGCGIERSSQGSNVWTGFKYQFGDIGPSNGDIVAHGLVFESL